ncbi:MAG: DUF4287 domain-containing protein [Rhodobacteraceae bacterium]|nr:DUF4287 domain-containing protein [Paracoccaceae bacterium]
MALDPEAMDAAVLRGLAAKTGRGLEDWLVALEAAGPFATPSAAVAWLKSQGMGHVTAQVVVRAGRPAAAGPTVEAVLGPEGAALFTVLVERLGEAVPELRIGLRKGYVTLGTQVQFAVAVRPKSGPGLRLGLTGQAEGSALPPAPPMGGSGRFRLLLDLSDVGGIEGAVVHLRAAAGGA